MDRRIAMVAICVLLAVLFHGVMCSEILVDVELGTIKGLVDREPAVDLDRPWRQVSVN